MNRLGRFLRSPWPARKTVGKLGRRDRRGALVLGIAAVTAAGSIVVSIASDMLGDITELTLIEDPLVEATAGVQRLNLNVQQSLDGTLSLPYCGDDDLHDAALNQIRNEELRAHPCFGVRAVPHSTPWWQGPSSNGVTYPWTADTVDVARAATDGAALCWPALTLTRHVEARCWEWDTHFVQRTGDFSDWWEARLLETAYPETDDSHLVPLAPVFSSDLSSQHVVVSCLLHSPQQPPTVPPLGVLVATNPPVTAATATSWGEWLTEPVISVTLDLWVPVQAERVPGSLFCPTGDGDPSEFPADAAGFTVRTVTVNVAVPG